ncbi:aminotransferase-like domain-containing protein [Salipiger marinus]|uniref:Transcriptional regulator, GntR family n=1 Tax=Salipiger marinus TaxID=555512 RepID=A0A1G8I187_9RHOB|nr:PLP-dependent aminotransferase family protein [Salipiger marinus]SDI12755.1 transcriptional regulator, GntR family [Salipiger marinus]
MAIPVQTFFLHPGATGTLQARIQQMVAEGVLSGRLRRGEKMPSTRALARHLGVSRLTVALAYTELLASDYLTSRQRSGHFISENAPAPAGFPPAARQERVDWARAIGQRFAGGAVPERPQDWASYRYPFIYGQTDPQLFDHASWRLCAVQALGARDFRAMTQDYYDRDDPELVEFITRQTLPRRGISARPEEVLITLGAQNALWLAAQVLLTPERTAALEDPGYPALRAILAQTRCRIAPVAVDAQGLPPEAIPDGTGVIFTAPSHQCPTSATLPMARREALLARARALDAIVVEDDYEFEMAYLTPALPALKSLDPDGRVVHVGSFSKSLFPGLRLGYLVGSEPFIREARALRAAVFRHPPGHVQRTAAHFLRLGHHDSLVRRIGRALTERRAVMEAEIARAGLTIAGVGAHGGSSFWMMAPPGIDTGALAETLRADSVLIEPGAPFFLRPDPPRGHYRLGYTSIPTDRIGPGITRIAEALARARGRG